jgi:hypothetical protein
MLMKPSENSSSYSERFFIVVYLVTPISVFVEFGNLKCLLKLNSPRSSDMDVLIVDPTLKAKIVIDN